MGLEDTDCDVLLNLNFLPQVLESQTLGTGTLQRISHVGARNQW